MPGLDFEKARDLIATTLKDLGKGELEIMWDSQNMVFGRIYQQHRRQVDGGTSIERTVMLNRKGQARYKSMFSTDKPTVDENLHKISVPWTLIDTNYSWDEMEILNNASDAKQILNLIRTRRAERMWDLAELIEERGWSAPESSTDQLNPYGIPYYLNFLDNGVTEGGFKGQTVRFGNGTTGTIVAGIDGAVEPKWRNYADTYSAFDQTLLKTLRKGIRATRFRPSPLALKMGKDNVGTPIEMYAGLDTVTSIEDLADQRDDNNKPKDLANEQLQHSFDGSVFFNRIPIVHAPHLDEQTVIDGGGNPFNPEAIYLVDWTKIIPVVHSKRWMVESAPMTDRGQHTTFTVFLDAAHQNLCINRRTAGAVFHKAIPAS